MRIFTNRLTLALALLVICQSILIAQTTGSISGTVTDQNGAVVPNATVLVKGEGGQEFTAVTKGDGTYNIPAVANGTYTVTITATGFKRLVTSGVKVDVGTPSTADGTLEIGDVEQVVEVVGGGEVLQTQTATVGTTIIGRQITETPLTSRDALDLVTLLPGTAQVGRPRQSTINGLPKGSMSISIDGVDVQDNIRRSSDGFFTFVRPRLDSVEEVTVSTASPGAESTGDGAVQIKFATKRGTNNYRGGLFWQHRDQGLNSNYWWNNLNGLPRSPIVLNQYGGNLGGPIPLPNFGSGGPLLKSGKDRAHFFVNYEEFRLPESINRSRNILTPDAQNGIFRYGTNSVNLLQIAAARGFEGTVDSTVASLLGSIRGTTSQGRLGPHPNANQQIFNFLSKGGQKRYFGTARLDFRLSQNHSLENVYNHQLFRNKSDFLNNFDPSFPGFPNGGSQDSGRKSNTTALRSTLTNTLINEARFSVLWGPVRFFDGVSIDQFQNQNGHNLNFNSALGIGALGLTNVTAGAPLAALGGFSAAGIGRTRQTLPSYDFTDNLTWLAGKHTITFGGQYKRIKMTDSSIVQLVPNIGFGVDSTDPIDSGSAGVFTTCTVGAGQQVPVGCNFPNATANQLAQAKGLYALLTGRVTQYGSTAFLTEDGTNELLGEQRLAGKQNTYGLYAQDTWRARPNLTLSFGLRWQPQEPFITSTSNFSAASSFDDLFGVSGPGNLFMPGERADEPTFRIVEAGYKAFKTDYNNFAPSVGVVYSPNFGSKGFLKNIFGQQDQSVFRAGYSMSFVREGTFLLLSILGLNPGSVVDASKAVADGTLLPGTLFRNIASVSPRDFPTTPPSVIEAEGNDSINVFDPNLKTGKVHSWSFGYQRELGKNTALEIRYVGNRGRGMWRQYNINEINTIENGFTDEFRRAQANLAANNAAGGTRVGSYAYFGAGSGTSPLPILQAYFSGPGDPNNPKLYTSTLYTNSAFIGLLNANNPNLIAFASNVDASSLRRDNAMQAGLPSNFFLANPSTRGGAFTVDNSTDTAYDGLQIELRRRLSNGLLVQSNYTFGKSMSSAYASSAAVLSNFRSLRDRGLSYTNSPFDVRHAFKLSAIYELPFGKGQPFFSSINRWTDALVGGWSVIPVIKLQSGTPINFGNVNLVGMTRKELQEEIGVYYDQTLKYGSGAAAIAPASFLPTDIIQNSFAAFNNQAFEGRAIVPAAYGGCIQQYVGQCGFSNLIVHGPMFFRTDFSLSKKIRFDEKRNVELRMAMYNALNNTQWRVGGWAADVVNVTNMGTAGFGQLTNGTTYQDTSTTNDPGGRTIELILRINF